MRSASSVIALLVNTIVFNRGAETAIAGAICEIRFDERRRVCRRCRRGRLDNEVRALSVKSMVSCWSCGRVKSIVPEDGLIYSHK